MTQPASAPRTARERARAELTREIKEEARRQLAAVGADGLSLRAVARELGMVSSALYRYYPSKDDLLTALIIDAYNAIGEAAETASASASASASGAPGRERWLAACHAIRAWALAHPHEYALIYGSPVPGYRAPQTTTGPAARVALTFVSILRDALTSGELAVPGAERAGAERAGAAGASAGGASAGGASAGGDAGGVPVPEPLPLRGPLADQAAALSAALALEGAPALPGHLLVRAVIAWTQLFGMVSFELFGQFVGSFDPSEAFFAYAAAQLAAFVGLRDARAAAHVPGGGT